MRNIISESTQLGLTKESNKPRLNGSANPSLWTGQDQQCRNQSYPADDEIMYFLSPYSICYILEHILYCIPIFYNNSSSNPKSSYPFKVCGCFTTLWSIFKYEICPLPPDAQKLEFMTTIFRICWNHLFCTWCPSSIIIRYLLLQS